MCVELRCEHPGSRDTRRESGQPHP